MEGGRKVKEGGGGNGREGKPEGEGRGEVKEGRKGGMKVKESRKMKKGK